MFVYRGSDNIIEAPASYFRGSDTDFGRGFYCCDDYQLAAEHSCMYSNNHKNIVNQYKIDLSSLNVLDFLDGTHTIMEWIGTILINRKLWNFPEGLTESVNFLRQHYGYSNISKYDAIIGWCTDDRYFTLVMKYFDNRCDIQELKYAMSQCDKKEQIVLVSPLAFNNLSNFQYYDVSNDFQQLNDGWRQRQNNVIEAINSLPLGNIEQTLGMLINTYNILETSQDIDEIEDAENWIRKYEQQALIQRKY